MILHDLDLALKTEAWNRKIINVYWIILFASCVIETVNLFLSPLDHMEFFLDKLVMPSLILLIWIVAAEIASHFFKPYADYVLISASTLISSTLIWIHEMPILLSSLFLSLLVAISYYNKRKIVYSSSINCIAFLILYFFDPVVPSLITKTEAVTFISAMLIAIYVACEIMKRGIESADYLKRSIETQHELMLQTDMMERLARTDALTGLHNHMYFHEHLDELIEGVEDERLSLHLAIIDIDNFKEINDTFGHHVGDLVLKHTASKMKEVLRADDFIARYGGEEFVVVFINQQLDHCHQIIDRVREAIANQVYPELGCQRVTISVGLNSYVPGMTKDQLFKGADSSLYQAKRTGKNKVVLFVNSA